MTNPGNLVASHPGNTSAVKHGAYSATGRVLAERAEELAELLMQVPHAIALDSVAAEEIGTIVARIEAIDRDLEAKGNGRKALLDTRIKLTRELRTWLREFGATPKARAEFARQLAEGGLAAALARRQVEREDGTDG